MPTVTLNSVDGANSDKMSGNKHFVRSEPRHRLVWALAVRGNEFASSHSSPMTQQKLAFSELNA